ncbi:hypothetical protein [Streptomyces clavuligerus]|nr:hypothetical protein [Streptomyces clavuligerus]WDN56784.1 hypothetical protein LL058_33805 [Streptomyces clavuligerus]
MADFVIDYETLYQLGKKAGELKKSVEDARANESGSDYTEEQLGWWTLPEVVGDFWNDWRYAFQRAGDVLGSVESTFTAIGKALFEQDASLASMAGTQAAQFDYADYVGKKQAYEAWQKLSTTYVTMHHRDEDGNLVARQVPLADASSKPELPGEPPKAWNYTDPDGGASSTNFTYGANGEVTGISSNIANKDGLNHKENTTFTGNGGYKTDIDHADGKSTSVEVTVSPDGTTGTRTIIDADGKKIEYQGSMTDDPKSWAKTLDQRDPDKQN